MAEFYSRQLIKGWDACNIGEIVSSNTNSPFTKTTYWLHLGYAHLTLKRFEDAFACFDMGSRHNAVRERAHGADGVLPRGDELAHGCLELQPGAHGLSGIP